MSVLDELSELEDKVRARMRELRPLLDEYSELEKVAQRLGLSTDEAPRRSTPRRQRPGSRAAAPASSAKIATNKPRANKNGSGSQRSASSRMRRSGSPAGATTTAKRRQPGDRRSEQVLAVVKQRPGITVRDLGSDLGIAPTSLYRVVKRLENQGALTKRGRGLQPS